MTFKITVRADNGDPVQGIWVSGNDMINGETFNRFTDGAGFCDLAMLGSCKRGDAASILVLDPEYRYKGTTQYKTLGEDQTLEIIVVPFA